MRLHALILLSVLGACATATTDDKDASETDTPGDTDTTTEDCYTPTGEGAVVSHFLPAGLASAVDEVSCELSDGSTSTCYRVQIAGAPSNHDVGPFCPRNIADDASTGGLWIEDNQTWDLDGAFIEGLATFYNDPTWKLYDDTTGDVNVTLTEAACAAAARPDVDPQYNNYCVECAIEDVDGGVVAEILIPRTPVARATPAQIGGTVAVGVALNGVRYDPPAPVDAILAAYTIAAFDDCGGHVNLVNGYHYHAATGCAATVEQCDAHAPLLGYALDGYGMYAAKDAAGAAPSDLDTCLGHTDDVRGYHYHVAEPGENRFLGCFHGHVAGADTTGGPGGPGGTDPIDCDDVAPGMPCCGDEVCDGPETAANCAADCG